MIHHSTTRRRLLAASTLGAVPFILPSYLRAADTAPSKRITMGFIGMGTQGRGLLGGFLGDREVQVVAVCDVDTNRREAAKKTVEGAYGANRPEGWKGCDALNNHEDLLARTTLWQRGLTTGAVTFSVSVRAVFSFAMRLRNGERNGERNGGITRRRCPACATVAASRFKPCNARRSPVASAVAGPCLVSSQPAAKSGRAALVRMQQGSDRDVGHNAVILQESGGSLGAFLRLQADCLLDGACAVPVGAAVWQTGQFTGVFVRPGADGIGHANLP